MNEPLILSTYSREIIKCVKIYEKMYSISVELMKGKKYIYIVENVPIPVENQGHKIAIPCFLQL